MSDTISFCGGCGEKFNGNDSESGLNKRFCNKCNIKKTFTQRKIETPVKEKFFGRFDKIFIFGVIVLVILIKIVFAKDEFLTVEQINKYKTQYQQEALSKREERIKLKASWYDYERDIQVMFLSKKELKKPIDETKLTKLFKKKDNVEKEYKKLGEEISCLSKKWGYVDENRKLLKECGEKIVRADDNLLIEIAKKKGINEKHFLALNKNENGAMIANLQAQAPLKSMYSNDKIKKIKLWCEDKKGKGEFPKDWDCNKEQGVGLFQINLWVHKGIKYEEASDPVFNAEWAAERLKSKGYDKDKLKAIQAHNGFKPCSKKDIEDKTCIGGFSYRYAYNVLNKAKSL